VAPGVGAVDSADLARQIASAMAPLVADRDGDVTLQVDGEVLGRVAGKQRSLQQQLAIDMGTNVHSLGSAVRMAARSVRRR
jgi:hypothetical protein